MLSRNIASFLVVLTTSFVYCARQLPTNTEPLSYYLSLTTYIHEEDYSFFGYVDIRIRALDTTDTITLHAENLDDLEVTLRDTSSNPPKVYHNLTYIEDKENDFLRVETPDNVVLQEGEEYTLSISFVGQMATNQSIGFYKMDFADSENRKVVLAATQFEDEFARRVFPCYDHPRYKTKFTIALTHGNDYKAYSNMPQDGPSMPITEQKLVTTKFQESPPLPTYAIAFLLAKGYKEYELGDQHSPIRQRIITSESVVDPKKMRFYDDFLSETYRSLQSYFGPLEHLPKLDHVSIPNTDWGGMENWGLIVYNAMYLEMSEDDQPSMRLHFNSILSHEVTHMWLGNTITIKDWDSLWLTESLTTFYGFRILDMTKPDWDVFNFSIRKVHDYAFTNPSEFSLSRPHFGKNLSNVEIYDYYKGCSLLRMIENVLSKKTMDKAVNNLISRYRYSTYDEDDFLTELQIAASEDQIQLFNHPGSVERVFKSWFHKPYFPIVTVTRSYDTGELAISQHSSQKNETHLWDIPINFATTKDPNFENTSAEYLLPKVSILTLNGNGKLSLDQNDWIIMNKQQAGHYVVNYDQHNWEVIAETLTNNHESIHYLNRAQIVRDLMILHSKDLISLEISFDVLSYMSQETDLTVWRSARDTFLYFNNLLNGGKAEEKFESFLRDILKEILSIVKIKNNDPSENPILSETRGLLLELACEVDYEECLVWARTELENYLQGNPDLDTGLFYTILFSGPKLLNDENFRKIKNSLLYRNPLLYVGLLQNHNDENVKYLLDESLRTRTTKYISAAFKTALLSANFDTVCNYFMGLPKESQDIILNELFSAIEKDDINYNEISREYLSEDNLKKIVNEKLFTLFRISEEKLTTIPDYRMNPQFAGWDDAAFEWLSEYELSFIYPTEDPVDITTPAYIPDEEESTFSAIFVSSDERVESTTLQEANSGEDFEDADETEMVIDIETIEPTTTASAKDYSSEEYEEKLDDNDEEDDDDDTPVIKEKTVTESGESEEYSEKGKVLVTSMSCRTLFRGLSFVTFMVVPFVILI